MLTRHLRILTFILAPLLAIGWLVSYLIGLAALSQFFLLALLLMFFGTLFFFLVNFR